MAYNEQTWTTICNFANGSDLADSDINPPVGYVKTLPPLVAGDSGEWVIECYEYYNSATENQANDFGTSPVATLWLKEKDVIDGPVQLATGAVSGAGNNIVTFAWDDDKITSYYAAKTCLIYAEVDDGTQRRTIFQAVAVVNQNGSALIVQETKNIPISTLEIATDTILTPYPGLVVVFVDASSNTVDITLPSPTAYDQQEIIVIPVDNTNAISIIGTVNGDAGPIVSAAGEKHGAHIFSDGAAWFNLNHTTVVT